MDRDAALAEDARQLLADLRVLERDDAVHELDQRHLGPEVAVHARPLDADRPRPDDRDPLRGVVACQRLVRGDDEMPVDVEAGQRTGCGAGGEDEVGGARLDVAALAATHPDAGGAGQRAGAVEDGDLVLLHEELDALDVLLHHRVAAHPERPVVEVDAIVPGEAELGPLLGDAVEQVGRLEQRLGRDAAAVQAGAAEAVALHEPHRQAELGGADGADVAHPTAEDEEVEGLLVGHRSPLAQAFGQVGEPAGAGRASVRWRSRERPSWAASRSRQASGTGIGRAVA